jgi:hypothetical protein
MRSLCFLLYRTPRRLMRDLCATYARLMAKVDTETGSVPGSTPRASARFWQGLVAFPDVAAGVGPGIAFREKRPTSSARWKRSAQLGGHHSGPQNPAPQPSPTSGLSQYSVRLLPLNKESLPTVMSACSPAGLSVQLQQVVWGAQ